MRKLSEILVLNLESQVIGSVELFGAGDRYYLIFLAV